MALERITWLGHATFLLHTDTGRKVLVDPWLQGNPKCPEAFHDVECDAILITHGHGDHIGDLFSAFERCSGPIVAIADIVYWLGLKSIPQDRCVMTNKGGTVPLDDLGLRVTMTDARHSSSFVDGDQLVTLGEAAGFVVSSDGGPSVYLAGDTAVFGDMKLIGELYGPDLAVLPIGDWFTMDPKAAALACEFLDVDRVIGCHWGTFPVLTGTPDQLAEAISARGLSTKVLPMQPGDTVDL